MAVRELFEKKLSKFNDEVIEYLNGFYDKLNKLVGLEKKNIAEISNKFYEDLRKKSSVDVADRINNIIASWYNDGLAGYLKFIGNEISWAKYILKTNKIKRSLRYKLFSKFVK